MEESPAAAEDLSAGGKIEQLICLFEEALAWRARLPRRGVLELAGSLIETLSKSRADYEATIPWQGGFYILKAASTRR